MPMSLQQVADKINANVVGEDIDFSRVSTDTRKISSGDLFVALKGDNFDGHDYVDVAIEKGASSLMVDHAVTGAVSQLIVTDTRIGYGQLAAAWRQQVNPRLVALTGSSGKTTLKEMLAAIFAIEHKVLATPGNLNNDIGVPATLLGLKDEDIAVIEMGANHVGEINYLSKIAEPDVAVLNNAGRAHIGEFGSEENIARTKAEIINGLKDGGIFIYNADSSWAELWRSLAADISCVSFGGDSQFDYFLDVSSVKTRWDNNGFQSCFTVHEKQSADRVVIALQLAGFHNAMNATAAVAVARQLGVDFDIIKKGLESLMPVKGRSVPCRLSSGAIVIDDTYNANPDSVEAAINLLATAPVTKILVLGDLAELGDQASQLQADIGSHAAAKDIDELYTCGHLIKAASDSFNGTAFHFDKQQALIDALKKRVTDEVVVLIKGSRSARMENVVEALLADGDQSC